MEPCRTPAVVIDVKDYGESDKIVNFYSLLRGRMCGIAKGAKRSLKRFVNKLELFTLLEIHFTDSRTSTLVRIDQAEPLAYFPALRASYERYTAATVLCELVLHWTRENDADPRLFELLRWGLGNLEDLQRPPIWGVILFQIKLLTLLGFQPDLSGCAGCGRLNPELAPYRFRLARGGLLCSPCSQVARPDDRQGLIISLSTAQLLKKGQELETAKLARLRFSPHEVQQATAFLQAYGNHILQREIQSWEQLVRPAPRTQSTAPRQPPEKVHGKP
jgi:DNA repair protein RecO (recombination protein O)